MSTFLWSPGQHKANELAQQFAAFPQVATVALGGSQSSGSADFGSDIDLYVYTEEEIPPEEQAALIERSGGATRSDLNMPSWGGVNMWAEMKQHDSGTLAAPGNSNFIRATCLVPPDEDDAL